MNAQNWLLIHYWLFLLEYFFPPRGGLGPKGCVGRTLMTKVPVSVGTPRRKEVIIRQVNWVLFTMPFLKSLDPQPFLSKTF